MSVSKEERQQARIDIRSWGADEKPELVERLLNALDEADSEKADLQRENERQRAALKYAGRYLDKIAHDRQMWQHKFREWAGLALIKVQKGLGKDPMDEWEDE